MATTKRKPTSPARVAANRLNALLSTGPKTEEGKARARANAVKHGLTGAGIALPQEDQTQVEQRFESIQRELAPQTVLGAFFAFEIALKTVRCQRAARHESALLTVRAQEAEANFDKARAEKVSQLFSGMPRNPGHYRPLLLATPEGLDRITGGLGALRTDLARPTMVWDQYNAKELLVLFGTNPADATASVERKLSDAVLGNFAGIVPAALEHCATDPERRAVCRDLLIEHIEAEILRLQEHRATLDHATVAQARHLVAERALFDASQEAILARRYGAASTRDVYRALREFIAVETVPEAEAKPATPEPVETIEPAPPTEPKISNIHELNPPLASFELPEPVAATPCLQRAMPLIPVVDRAGIASKLRVGRDDWCSPLPAVELPFSASRR